MAGTGAPDPYAGKDLAHYRTAQVQNVPDAEFEALLGRPIPENKVHIDRNMTLGEMGHGRSPIGWQLPCWAPCCAAASKRASLT